MTDQHRATPQQWERIKQLAKEGWEIQSAIYELCSRIEALEAAQQDKLDRLIALDAADPTFDAAVVECFAKMTELRAASAEARPAGLVERVAHAIGAGCGPDSVWRPEARDAIREVAAWFRMGDNGAGSAWTVAADVLDAVLKQEASHD